MGRMTIALLAVVAVAGCGGGSVAPRCQRDADCPEGQSCADSGLCVSPEDGDGEFEIEDDREPDSDPEPNPCDALPPIDTLVDCDALWLDEVPAGYPPAFDFDPAALERANRALDCWLAEIGGSRLVVDDIWIDPVTSTVSIHETSYPAELPVIDAPPTTGTFATWISVFLVRWQRLFAPWPVTLSVERLECTGSSIRDRCYAYYRQEWCGRQVSSGGVDGYGGTELPRYHGSLSVLITRDGSFSDLSSTLVPMLPLPHDPVLTPNEAAAILRQQAYHVSCQNGLNTYPADDSTPVEVDPVPEVFVHREGDNRLIERLAYRALVWPMGDALPPWTAWVDAIDGAFLGEGPRFICD